MSGQVSVNGAVEVLLDRGIGYSPRWTVGSGFLIGGTQVLTAAHNVGEGELSVRVRRGTEYIATIAQVGDVDQGLDLAIVNITDPSFREVPDAMVQFAKLNRDSPDLLPGCWAIGFPRFKEKDLAPSGRSRLRDTAQINGEIPLAANLISDMLELRVTATPQASPSLGSSEWEGMSGAVVFCKDPVHGDRAIGVIVEHYQPEGTSSLTVVPITAINKLDEPTAHKWWNLLGVVDHQGLPHLPPEPHIELVSAERIYRQQVINKYKSLDFGGFARSDLLLADVPLEEVFVRLSLTVEKVIREPGPSEKSSQGGRRESRQRERVITLQEPIELGKALGNHLLIVGEPGAGKSTLLRWLAVTFAGECQREPDRLGPSADVDRLPVLVELGRLHDRYLKPEGGETPAWRQYLPEYLTAQEAFANTPPQLLTQALVEGRCLLLFDGLDEIADRQVRARIARSLAELARHSPGNRVIIGSRPAGVSESEGVLRPQFQRCQIQRFTPEDVQRFFRFWYTLDSGLTPEQQRDEADALYASVQATPATLQLASTPLLSTILVLIWRNEGYLPARRVELYERCCRMLIERWEASHDVKYQGALIGMDWEDRLRLLTPLAYAIHSQEQRTSATREELVPRLAQALQTAEYATEHAAAIREAKLFLDTLGLRSGLLQSVGDDRYGFPHQTLQEYLAARYIAAQDYPEYIDLVMAHLHEAWWQQVHLLTIAHLGVGNEEANKASTLILTILHVYRPPSWILRSSRSTWLRLIEPGKFLPQMQLDRRIAWMLAREFDLASRGYLECAPDGTTPAVGKLLSAQAALLVRHIIYDGDRLGAQQNLLTTATRVLRHQGNEIVLNTLLAALHNDKWQVRAAVAQNLAQVEIGTETVINALLTALDDDNEQVRAAAAQSLAQLGTNEAVVNALLATLHDDNEQVRRAAARSLAQLGTNNEAMVKVWLVALDNDDDLVREMAVESLAQLGTNNEAVVNALLTALHDDHWGVRWSAAQSLRQVGIDDKAVVSALLTALDDDNWEAEWMVAGRQVQGGTSDEVVSSLLTALHDADWKVKNWAAGGSWVRVEIDTEAEISALLIALHDDNERVRAAAVRSLGQMGTNNEAVVSTLLTALRDDSDYVRTSAVQSLAQVGAGNEAVVRALWQIVLHDEYESVRADAAWSLGQVETNTEAKVKAWLIAMHYDDFMVIRLDESLKQVRIDSEAVISILLAALHERDHESWFFPDVEVRGAAIQSLGRARIKGEIQLQRVLVALNRQLHSVSWRTRRPALNSISQLLDGRALPGYQWVSLQKRRAGRLRLKRIVFWFGTAAFMVLIGLVATWLLGLLDPNGFLVRLLAVLAGIIAFVAAVAQVLGRTLRDPWEHS